MEPPNRRVFTGLADLCRDFANAMKIPHLDGPKGMLTDEQYQQAIQLCRNVLDAYDSDDGGGTVSGSYLGQLRELLTTDDDDRPHEYLSTACYHLDHDYCNAMTGYSGRKRPGQCKFCEAKCTCQCHR
jgi:hypothetical protein